MDKNYIQMPYLKKCPHCGGWATLKKNKDMSTYFIECVNCHTRTDDFDNLEFCNIAWNNNRIFMPIEDTPPCGHSPTHPDTKPIRTLEGDTLH